MQTIVYQCDTAMPAQKLPNCCNIVCRFIWHQTSGYYYQAHSKHKFGKLEENSICSNKEHMCNHGKSNDYELSRGNL